MKPPLLRRTGRGVGVVLALLVMGAGRAAAERIVDDRPFRILDAPLAAGARVDIEPLTLEDGTELVLEVSPVEVFAKDVEIVVHGPNGDSHIAPPSDHWFTGRVAGDPESFVVLARGNTLRGLVVTGTRVAAISPAGDAYGTRPAGPSYVRSFSPETDVPEAMRNFICGADSLTNPPGAPAITPSTLSTRRPLNSVNYYAGVAIETDYEMFQTKGSAPALSQYVGDLFAAAMAIYQRDLRMTLQVNYLSIWTTPSDPWVATTSINGLYEFGDYWHAHRSAVPRKTAHFLSGRHLGGGVAWLGVLCYGDFFQNGHYGGGYGISGNMSGHFSTTNPALYWDILVGTHEIGHNFDTPHTHCYSPPVDKCYSGEPGCYSGPTSVPPEKGTIMSYCHLVPPNYYSNVKLFFGVPGESSQAVTTLMRNYIEALGSSCFGTVAGPVVLTIAPPSGSTAGGTPVTITGSGFTAPATVKIGGTLATSVVVSNSTTITAVTPAGPAGAADVSVIVTGDQGATLAAGYTYTSGAPPPTVTAINPNHGSTLGGTPVTITGTGFVNGATVTIGGVSATSVVFVNSTTLTATTGAHSAGIVNVTVTNPDLQSGTLTNGYTYGGSGAAKFYTQSPCRVLDTRNPIGPLGGPALPANGQRSFTVTGTCGIPGSATAISANVTVVPSGVGSLAIFPGDGADTGTNTVSFATGWIRADNGLLALATNGTGSILVINRSTATTHVIVDVNGYFQ